MSPRVLSSEAREPERRARRVPGADVFVREGVLHAATDHADSGLSECQEVMGLLVGRVYEDASGMYAEVTGIVTDQCVACTVRGLADAGYKVICVEDACAAGSMELHDAELKIMNVIYCDVLSTDETIALIEKNL